MTPCAYTRRNEEGLFEYGQIILHNTAMKNERREYVPLGVKPTIDEALKANQMALKGMPRIGNNTPIAPLSWSELYGSKRNTVSEELP